MVRMGLWLFHRKSHKRSRSGANLSDQDVNGGHLPVHQSEILDVHSKSKRQRTNREPNKLRRRNRNLSYSPGRQDSIQVSSQRRRSREHQPQHRIPGTSTTARRQHPTQPSTSPHRRQGSSVQQTPQPPSGPGSRNGSQEWYRVPTLRHRPPSTQINHTKSSKRRRVDRGREAEIRAMTATFEPVRPATEEWMSGRPIRKDSRRVRPGGLFGASSEISLPSVASIQSNMSTDSEHVAFRVSAIHSLAPRPTLRYSYMNSQGHQYYGQYGYGVDGSPQEGSGPSRNKSQRTTLGERPPIPEATLRAHKRIDDLADDLSAGDIRELMDRDKRRRERKQQRDQDRMERRLARQVQREQQQQQQRAQKAGGPSTGPNLDRGVLGRELASMGASQPPSAVVTSSRPRRSAEDEESHTEVDEEGASRSNRESTSSSQPRPLEQFHRPESIHLPAQNNDEDSAREQHRDILASPPRESDELLTETSEIINEEPSLAVAAAIAAASGFPQRKSSLNKRKSDRRVLTKKSRSKSPPLTHQTQGIASPIRHDDTSTTHKSSEMGGSGRGRTSRLSWSAIFKWPGRRKRFSAGPSSFSNTSRDSMQAAYITSAAAVAAAAASSASATSSTRHPGSVPIAPNITFIPPQADGTPSIPRRTVSRFREDLPETVISRSTSRIQSPAAEVQLLPTPIAGEDLEPEYHSGEPTPTQDSYAMSNREVDMATPTSMQTLQMSSVDASPEPQSMSMASVDSEASWLGGAFGGSRTRPRISSLNKYQQLEQQHNRDRAFSESSNTNKTECGLGLKDEECLTRLSPTIAQPLRISTGMPQPTSVGGAQEDGEATWGTLPRTPTVHHKAHKMKSSEVLLNTYQEGSEEDDKEMRVDDEKEDSGINDEKEDSGMDTEPESPEGAEDTVGGMQRATSINLGLNHVRHISAGSAKLLELTPRASIDTKRRSFEPPGSITQ